MSEDRKIELDRMRFEKNKTSTNLTYLAILADVFFFICIYQSDVGTWYYNIMIGASIIYNLIFMLAAFLSSEGVKNYMEGYSWLLGLLGIIQVARIFIIPVQALAATVTIQDQTVQVMGGWQFARCVIYLLCSAICCFSASAIGIRKSRALNAHLASLEAEGN